MKRRYWMLSLLVVMAAFFLMPIPSTAFLYRNAAVLEGKVESLKGASFGIGLDPAFYYKFTISPGDIDITIAALGLGLSAHADYELAVMQRDGPLFWNAWWWRPAKTVGSVLYSGYVAGNIFYLLYDRDSQVAYLYIQNT